MNLNFDRIYKETVDLLTEKDHRPTMVNKMGIPQEVADYLHSLNDKRSLWFGKQITQIPAYQRAENKLQYVQQGLQTPITAILDWIRGAQNVNLNQHSFQGAIEAASEWHAEVAEKERGEFVPTGLPEGASLLKSYKDGMYWIDLETTSCSLEGNNMGHCGTTHKGDTLFSLRSENGEPHVTMAISPDDGVWYQCKGRSNQKPDEKYHKYICDILDAGGVYEFQPEYNASDDFKGEDFKSYVEDNPDEFEDPEGLADKIVDETEKNAKEASEDADRYNERAEHTSIYVSDDYEEYVTVDGSFTIEIEGEPTKDIPHRYASTLHIEYGYSDQIEIEVYEGSIHIRGDVRYDGYSDNPIEMVDDLSNTLQEFEANYDEMKQAVTLELYNDGYLKKLPYELEVAQMLVDEYEEFGDEELGDLITSVGIEVYGNGIPYTMGLGDINPKINDALVEIIDIIKARVDDKQMELKFEAWKIKNDDSEYNNFQFASFGKPDDRVLVTLFADVESVKDKDTEEFTKVIKYILTEHGANLITIYLNKALN